MKQNENKATSVKVEPILAASFKDGTYCTCGKRAIEVERQHAVLIPLLYGLANSVVTPFSLVGDDEVKQLTDEQLEKMTGEELKKAIRSIPKVCEDIRELGGAFLDIRLPNYRSVISYDGMYWVHQIYRIAGDSEYLLVEGNGNELVFFSGTEKTEEILRLDVDYIEDLDYDLEGNGVTGEMMGATSYLKELKDDGCFYSPAGFLYDYLCLGNFVDLIPYFEVNLRKYAEEFNEFFDSVVVATGDVGQPQFLLDISRTAVEKIEGVAERTETIAFYTVSE